MAARTPLTQQVLSAINGVGIDYESLDTTNGNIVPNTGREVLIIKTPAASGATVTVVSIADPFDIEEDAVAVVGASTTVVMGPFDPRLYGDGQGNLFIDYSSFSGTPKIAVVLIP